jgi:hypothetical protein
MSKIWIILIAAVTGSLACVMWLLPLGYAFQVVLLGLMAGFLSYVGTVPWKIWGPILLIPSILLQAILMTKTQSLDIALAMQGPQWVPLVLAVATGAIVGDYARRRGSIAAREPATGHAPRSRRRFYVVVPAAALALSIAFAIAGYADPLLIEFGLILVGVPAALLGIVLIVRRNPAGATVFLSIPLFFVALLPLQPLTEIAEEARSLGAMRSYCETLVPMLRHIKETTGNYPSTLLVPPFSEVETPFSRDHRFGGVQYSTDEKQFNFIVYRHEPRDRSQTYNSETRRWVDGTHYPSSHTLCEMPERTRVLTIDGSGNQSWGWR